MRLTDSVHVFHDTCDVHLLVNGTDTIAGDVGSGRVPGRLAVDLAAGERGFGRHAEALVDLR